MKLKSKNIERIFRMKIFSPLLIMLICGSSVSIFAQRRGVVAPLNDPCGGTTSVIYNCTSATVKRNYAPQSGWTAYWQTTATGTSTGNPATSFTVSTNGTWYSRERMNTWSSVSCPAVVALNTYVPSDYIFTVNKTTIWSNESLIFSVTRNGSEAGLVTSSISWGDGSPVVNGPALGTWTHNYVTGTYTLTDTLKTSYGCKHIYSQIITVLQAPLCSTSIPNAIGVFKQDKLTGDLIFSRADCPVQSLFSCVSTPNSLQTKVISSGATTFSDNWPFKEREPRNAAALKSTANSFEAGEKGKWRPKASYTYNTPLNTDERNYSSGHYNYQRFNWAVESANGPKWIRASEVLAYSPNGDGLSERNALDIRSAAKFGYDNALPVLTAQNASYESVMFESFEKVYTATHFEDSWPIPANATQDATYSHSGSQSLKLLAGGSIQLRPMNIPATSSKMLVKVWVRLANPSLYPSFATNLSVTLTKGSVSNTALMKIVARTGDWILCQATVNAPATEGFTPQLTYSTTQPIWFDDLRIQPADAQMNCYVYDPKNLRLLASFDDQHFGLYYQYNAEGKLVRKMIETRDGIKTLQETQYNLKQVAK
jgi:hypothetical protein